MIDARVATKAREVVEANRAAGLCFALAESCTGGLVAGAVTGVPGASEVFERGWVTYSNASKLDLLGVSPEVVDTFGAVSIACAWAMAQGALERSRADLAVAITGIAGPSGGSAAKPVGTVIFARARRNADPSEIIADAREFGDMGREEIRVQAVLCALELLMPTGGAAAGP